MSAAIKAATHPRDPRDQVRLLVLEPSGALRDTVIAELPQLLAPGDVLVVNDAATLPASLPASHHGVALEVRLAAIDADGSWQVVLFGAGDWRTPTEHRPAPQRVAAGDRLAFGDGLAAAVLAVSDISPRLVRVRFLCSEAELLAGLYRLGVPVQYAYLDAPLPLHAVQTAFAVRPWAVELPSAGRPLSYRVLAKLRARGVDIATVTHAAGLSSTGDPELDRALPLPERYEVPAAALWQISDARARGGRVLAAGTTVVRALEASAAAAGASLPLTRSGMAELRIGAGHQPAVVDGVLTGIHVPGESHYDLLSAFAPPAQLERAAAHALAEGYLCHEFGDAMLVLPWRQRVTTRRSPRRDAPSSQRASKVARAEVPLLF